jgi:hypothetical protein
MAYTPEEIQRLKAGTRKFIKKEGSDEASYWRIPEFYTEDAFNDWAFDQFQTHPDDLNERQRVINRGKKLYPDIWRRAVKNESIYNKTKPTDWWGLSDQDETMPYIQVKKGGQIKKRMKKKRVSRKPRGVGKALRGYGKVVKSG